MHATVRNYFTLFQEATEEAHAAQAKGNQEQIETRLETGSLA